MYHQFDRSMHPRQSILKTILTLREKSRKTESILQALENVSRHALILFIATHALHLRTENLVRPHLLKWDGQNTWP